MISHVNAPNACRLLGVLALLLSPALLVAVSAAPDGSATRDLARAAKPNAESDRTRLPRSALSGKSTTRRLREGTIINDQAGYFSENGDTASFMSDTGMEFGTLQNLNLERVVKLLKNADEPSSIRWSVTGTVTEFSGRNYILISRAVYKSATPPPVPDRVSH